MHNESLAHYLAAIGVIGLCEVGSRWNRGRCEFGAPLEEISASLEAALAGNKLLPHHEVEHPLWCNRARRSLARGAAEAREWLAMMDAAQRASELSSLLAGEGEPQKLKLPPGPSRPNPNWNLGTLMPAVIGDPPAALASAWLPVLAWEAQRVILTTECRANGSVGALEGDVYSWMTYEWWEPLTIAEVFLLLNGGEKRWHFCGLPINCARQVYHLRDTAGGGKTLEFCRGASWVGIIE